jgi:hypothetical protein
LGLLKWIRTQCKPLLKRGECTRVLADFAFASPALLKEDRELWERSVPDKQPSSTYLRIALGVHRRLEDVRQQCDQWISQASGDEPQAHVFEDFRQLLSMPSLALHVRLHLLEALSDCFPLRADSLVQVLRALCACDFAPEAFNATRLSRVGQRLTHADYGVRKWCVRFLLAAQAAFPLVSTMLVAYLTFETADKLRLRVIAGV